MKTRQLITGTMSMIAMLGLGVQPSLADSEYGSAHASAGSHGGYEERMGHHGHAADHLRHMLKHQQEIGLTEEQVKKLKTVELDYDRARIKADAEILVAERELLALVEDEKTDLSALEAKVKQSEMLEVGLRMSAFKARRDALAVLTPEQREKAKASHEKRMQEMRSGTQGSTPRGSH
ncbi:MAG: periplasmic heavy metal sensor [Nitrospira sp.]|nr:periplasmic heavy metal sensor [Nitrospira sp.]